MATEGRTAQPWAGQQRTATRQGKDRRAASTTRTVRRAGQASHNTTPEMKSQEREQEQQRVERQPLLEWVVP